MSTELSIAQMETSRAVCEDEYFAARPQADTYANRALFRAAFERGWQRAVPWEQPVGKNDD